MSDKLHGLIKSKRLVSNGLKLFGHDKLAAHAHLAGYGRRRVRRRRVVRRPVLRRRVTRRRVRHRQQGGALKDTISKLHTLVKSKRVISSGLKMFGQPKLARIAYQLGYGRRRRVRRRRMAGGNIFGTVWNAVKSVPGRIRDLANGKTARRAKAFIKDNKLISRGLGLVPNPLAKFAGIASGMAGWGRRRVIRRRGAFPQSGGMFRAPRSYGAIII